MFMVSLLAKFGLIDRPAREFRLNVAAPLRLPRA